MLYLYEKEKLKGFFVYPLMIRLITFLPSEDGSDAMYYYIGRKGESRTVKSSYDRRYRTSTQQYAKTLVD